MEKSTVIAITGGIGTGKSTVAKLIKEQGHIVISSDENAKLIIKDDIEIQNKIIDEFGAEAFTNGMLNSQYISKTVFGPTDDHEKSLMKLNSIIHPKVIEKMIQDVEKLERQGEKIIFVESALTFEAGLEEGFDYIITVDCEEDVAIERVMKRSSLSEEEVRLRMAQQLSNQVKRERADFAIDNNGNIEKLHETTDFILNLIQLSVSN